MVIQVIQKLKPAARGWQLAAAGPTLGTMARGVTSSCVLGTRTETQA